MKRWTWAPRWLTVTYVAVTLVLLVAFLFCQNSYFLMCKSAGLDYAQEVAAGVTANGDEYRVLVRVDDDGATVAYCVKNGFLDTWRVELDAREADPETGMVSFGWNGPGQFRTGGTEFAYHWVYVIRDPQKQLSLPLEGLPANTAASLGQVESAYILHLVQYGENAVDPDVPRLLREGGYLP